MEKAKIDRISELSRKSRVQPLTEEEKREQQALRQEYIDSIQAASNRYLVAVGRDPIE